MEKTVSFYRERLGFTTDGIVPTSDDPNDDGRIALFMLEGGLILSLYPKTSLSTDTKIPLAASNPLEFSLMHQVESKEAVDSIMNTAKGAGASITDAAHDRGGGVYSGFFQDIDGHLWEIVSSV